MSAYHMHNLSASFSVFCFCHDYCLGSSLDEADVHISTGCQDDLALLTVNGKKSRQEICWIFFICQRSFAENNGLAPSYAFSLGYLITLSSFE